MKPLKVGIVNVGANIAQKENKIADKVLTKAAKVVEEQESTISVYSRYSKQTYTPPGSPFWDYKLGKNRYGR